MALCSDIKFTNQNKNMKKKTVEHNHDVYVI